MGDLRSNFAVVIGTAWILTACGAGIAPDETTTTPASGTQSTPQGCESTGQSLDFTVDSTATSLFWAEDARINPGDPATDQSKVKVLFDIPPNSLPTGVASARIQIAPVPRSSLPAGIHVDTAFRITAIAPSGLTTLTGADQNPLTLALRYDPVECEIPPEVEATLLLARLSTSGEWQDICGDPANPSAAVREVSCTQGDLSFGIFGVVPALRNQFNDPTPPTFPARSLNLSSPAQCAASCAPAPWIDFEWGPATDGGGSGIKGYWVYVDGRKVVFTTNITTNPVRYRLVSSGTLDTTQPHLYQVSAVDNADNESSLFGSLKLPLN